MVLRTKARRSFVSRFSRCSSNRFLSTASEDLVKISVEESVATLTMNRRPVNSLSLEMCLAMSSAIKDIEQNSKVQSLVLSSSNPSIFSAGLDMKEMYNPDHDRLNEFWTSFQQLFIDLYGSRLATIAAIEGHAPAAGCMLALSCDYRVMCADDSFSIGLNEAKFGIAAPSWLGELMLRTIGFRQGEMALALGTLFNPNEALGVGLVDLTVDRELVLESSYEIARRWGKIPPHARVATKQLARGQYISDLKDKRKEDLDYFTSFVLTDKVQTSLGFYLESLSKRQKSR